MDLAHRRLTPDFTFICFWWKHELSAVIYACTAFDLFEFFPGVFLSSRVTGACPVTTKLIRELM